MTTPQRWAVVGTGHLGRIHARLTKQVPGVELVAVVEPVAAARDAVAAECQVSAYSDVQECLGRIDAAVIATPTRCHHAVAAELLRSGVHVLIEKPITLNSADADELIVIAERKQLVVQVGHVERFNPAFVAAQSHLGRPVYIDATRSGPYSCRSTDIGVVLDLMIHDLDLILSLVPSELLRVEALGMPVFGPNEDLAQARLTFADGCVANVQASRVSPTAQRTMNILFETGFAALDFSAKTAEIITPSWPVVTGQIDVNCLTAEEKNNLKERLFVDYLPRAALPVMDHNAILEEQKNFAAAIRGEAAVVVGARDGRRAVDAAERVLASLAEHSAAALPAGWRRDAGHEKLRGPHRVRSSAAARRQAG